MLLSKEEDQHKGCGGADPHLQQHLAGADRGVGQSPHVPAMDTPGLRPAPGTGERRRSGAGVEPHHHRARANTPDAQPGQVREQHPGRLKIRTLTMINYVGWDDPAGMITQTVPDPVSANR
jgi:hypothetical protein